MSSANIIEQLAQNPTVAFFGTVLGTLLGIVGLIATIYIYNKTRSFKRIQYSIQSYQVVGPKGMLKEHLTIAYKKYPVTSLTVSKVCIWNSGTEPINKDDVALKDPLRITVDGHKLLDAELVYVSNEYFGVNDEIESPDGFLAWVRVDFDYIDPRKGLVIRVVHTGTGSSDLRISGTLKGAGSISEESLSKTEALNNKKMNKYSQVSMGLFFAIALPLQFGDFPFWVTMIPMAITFLFMMSISLYFTLLSKNAITPELKDALKEDE
jgi:hypothetical protein